MTKYKEMEQLNKKKKYLAIIEFLSAVILATVLFPFGLIYNLYLPFKRKYNIKRLVKFFKDFVSSIYTLTMYMLHQVAYTIDVLGNVIVGELFEDIITTEEDTLFSNPKHSISQSIGYLQHIKKLNKRGLFFQKSIDKVFGKNHCINAFLHAINK